MKEVKIQQNMEEFLRKYYEDEILRIIREGEESLFIDFSLLNKFNPDLGETLLDEPEKFFENAKKGLSEIEFFSDEKKDLNIRVRNLPNEEKTRIKDIRSRHIGKFIKIDGTVRRASEVKPEIHSAIFECPDCGEKIEVRQVKHEGITYPETCECGRKKGFKMIDKELFDTRYMTIEDPYETVSGESPGEITVFLKDDMTTPRMQKKTDAGARLEVSGILKHFRKRQQGKKTKKIEVFMEGNYVEPSEIEFEDLEITEEDEKKIKDLAKNPNIYKLLVDSLAPSMYGLRRVKEAIILQLFGGVPHILADGTRIRGDLHILLVGDPSSGKTQLLKLTSDLMPRARYVSGKGTSAAGLTASVIKDEELMGGWVLEAGALVLANKSLISIDEFDKINKEDQINLHEAMSKQTISIAKASIFATLPAQTSVLAGANPKFSRFDTYRPISEQIDIPETLLSRFDIKFIIQDLPNKERDEKMIDHIIENRFEKKEEENKNPVEQEILKKYIAYARQNCHPVMTKKAAKKLKEFYLRMRNLYLSSEGTSTVPITLRQYEALIRLSEASAKIRLSKRVGQRDAKRAISLMEHTIKLFGLDPETGQIDIDRAEGGTSSSKRSKIRRVMDVLDKLTEEVGKNIPMEDVLAALEDEGIEDGEEIIRQMKNKGIVFEPRSGQIQKI